MTIKRQIFYSFHYASDSWRASQVRNIGVVEGSKPASDNDWEEVKRGGDDAIRKWISGQMKYRSCTVVLVGSHTANRKWINHEIIKSWNDGMAVVGIYIHGLKDYDGYVSNSGHDPFDYITFNRSGKALSSLVKCYEPIGLDSKEKYAWISNNLSKIVEEAIWIRGQQ